MIRGLHAMFYSSEPEALRAFLRDTLGFRACDVGHGWLILEAPEADLGVHPVVPEAPGGSAGTHQVSFYCDDVAATVAELREKGVEFTQEIEDQGFGLVTAFRMPGGVVAQLYQPRYEKRFD